MSEQFVVTLQMSIQEAWEKVLDEVREAAGGARHPFRYVTLATVDSSNSPNQRTVVLRDFDGGSEFTIYTDCRSDKVAQIGRNDSVSLHFYHGEKKLQLRVTGTARVVSSGEDVEGRWQESASKNPESYTSVIAPGTGIDHPEEAYEWDLEGAPNFCIIEIRATYMEFLQLDGVKHIRGEKKILPDGKETAGWIAP